MNDDRQDRIAPLILENKVYIMNSIFKKQGKLLDKYEIFTYEILSYVHTWDWISF